MIIVCSSTLILACGVWLLALLPRCRLTPSGCVSASRSSPRLRLCRKESSAKAAEPTGSNNRLFANHLCALCHVCYRSNETFGSRQCPGSRHQRWGARSLEPVMDQALAHHLCSALDSVQRCHARLSIALAGSAFCRWLARSSRAAK